MSSKPVYQRRPRYRQVSTQVFADEKFCQLSRPKPSGQSLWLFLLLGPHTRALPGLFSAGRAALAEALGWSVPGFQHAWHEIEKLGMAQADWKARVVWMPNAIRHNPPPNPNVIRGWRSELSDVPECALKCAAVNAFGIYCARLGEPFVQAFREALGEGSLNGSRKGSGNGSPNGRGIQEQDQEQDQDQERTE